jgi:hypothetical protein
VASRYLLRTLSCLSPKFCQLYQTNPVPGFMNTKFSAVQGGVAYLEVCVGPIGSSNSWGAVALLLAVTECSKRDAILTPSNPASPSTNTSAVTGDCRTVHIRQLTAADVAQACEAATGLSDHQFLGFSQSVIPQRGTRGNVSSLHSHYQLF